MSSIKGCLLKEMSESLAQRSERRVKAKAVPSVLGPRVFRVDWTEKSRSS